MSDVMREVDERSKLAGTNKFELLIFRLGEDRNSSTREVFGMNVFKVREALIMPSITPMPGSPKFVLGVANIRGQIIPVIDLPSVVGCTPAARNILLVTEYERSVQDSPSRKSKRSFAWSGIGWSPLRSPRVVDSLPVLPVWTTTRRALAWL